jgi:hypothetical protein
MMTELKQGDTVYLVASLDITEIRYWGEAFDGGIWAVYPEDCDNALALEDEELYFVVSKSGWRPTRAEALQLLREN